MSGASLPHAKPFPNDIPQGSPVSRPASRHRWRGRVGLLASVSAVALVLVATPATVRLDDATIAPNAAHGLAPRSCFIAGTKVLMADGTEKHIEDVVVGDHLIGQDGNVNTVRGLDRTTLGERWLHALNGGEHFVTAEHPFMTEHGWKALDPRATLVENPNLAVGRLRVGDRLVIGRAIAPPAQFGNLALAAAIDYASEYVTVTAITAVADNPDLPLYNFILDGNHSYHADGYLVHNKDVGAGATQIAAADVEDTGQAAEAAARMARRVADEAAEAARTAPGRQALSNRSRDREAFAAARAGYAKAAARAGENRRWLEQAQARLTARLSRDGDLDAYRVRTDQHFGEAETAALIETGWAGPDGSAGNFADFGERMATMIAIARTLGHGPRVGALQASFGTPRENGLEPGRPPTPTEAAGVGAGHLAVAADRDWMTADLDTDGDGDVDQEDLTVAIAGGPE